MKKNHKRGYFGIGVYNMKNNINYGTLFRSAYVFNADFIFLIGRRFKRQASDTPNSSKHVPLYEYENFDDFNKHRPYECELIGVEITPLAIPINKYKHPERAIYLLGAEDHGLSDNAKEHCQEIIILPGDYCLNVAVAGSIVMYDRILKIK